ncbi:hypothetical protein OG953_09180 [Streptomyces sp. NBC_00057]
MRSSRTASANRHEPGRARAPGDLVETVHGGPGNRRPAQVALGRLRRIGGTVGRQRHPRAVQPGTPVAGQAVPFRRVELVPLPAREVRVLDGERGKPRRNAAQGRVVGVRQFGVQERHRPAVAGDVVHGEQKQVLPRSEPEQFRAQEGAGSQVEPGRLRRGEPPGNLGGSRAGQVANRQRHPRGRPDDLVQRAVALGERGAQRLVPRDHAAQRGAQCVGVEGAAERHGQRHGVRRSALLQLSDHPQPGLRVRGGDERPGRVPPRNAGPSRPALLERLQQPSPFR